MRIDEFSRNELRETHATIQEFASQAQELLLAEMGGKVKECSRHLWRQLWKRTQRSGSPPCRMWGRCGHAFVAFGRSNPQGAAAMLPTSWHPQQGPGILPRQSRTAALSLRWMPGRRVLVLVVLFVALVAIIRPLNQLGPLQWQKGVNGCRHGVSAYSSCLNCSHSSSFARKAFLTSQMRSSLPHSTNQRHPAPHVSLIHRQLLPCLSCGPDDSTEWGPFKKWLPQTCKGDFLLAQETHLPMDALATEESWMRLQGWRACVAPTLFLSPQRGEWVSTKQTTRSKGSAGGHGCSTAAARIGDAARWCWRQGH